MYVKVLASKAALVWACKPPPQLSILMFIHTLLECEKVLYMMKMLIQCTASYSKKRMLWV